MITDLPKPELRSPFPDVSRYWKDPKTGIIVPKFEQENIEWRINLLQRAENDEVLQDDLMAACKESMLFWINAFAWTYHQFDVDINTGKRIDAKQPHRPFITWEIQDELFNEFETCLKIASDILIDKARDMGASWACVDFIHWLWLFRPDSQLLELSRTEDYVDKAGNMKALFQKHDYINDWLSDWMLPPSCHYREKNRTKMHLENKLNGSVIDGESTTEHAASGDRRLVTLLDEFAKVDNGALMRSATRDASYIRIVNSTPAGPGTEYSRWKNDKTKIKIFILPFYEHPEKGYGRHVVKTDIGEYQIRSPWFDVESTVRSPKELAREVLRQDVESGDVFFTTHNIDKHIAMYVKEPNSRWSVKFKDGVAKSHVKHIIRTKNLGQIEAKQTKDGPLRIWTNLILGRPDQSKSYIFGVDVSKGHGASNSVISIKCKQTGEKIAEWRDANTQPHDLAFITIALALWCGGANPTKLPFLKWEKNGPGLDFGKLIVKTFNYPFYYRKEEMGTTSERKTSSYGWHNSIQSKEELLSLYDRVLAHGGYVNHSRWALEEAKMYIYYTGGGIGPAGLVEENAAAKKTHGDVVMADALTLDDKDLPKIKFQEQKIPVNSMGHRLRQIKDKKKKARKKGYRRQFDFSRMP